MPDFNKILDAGDVDSGIINTVIEIPKGSMHKIEWNRELACFQLDRVEPGIFAKPVNYGFIPQTLDEDGDELDTLVVTEEGIPTGVYVQVRVIGILNFDDGGEMDHKVICVPEDDRHYGEITSLEQLPPNWKASVEHHFNHYKDLKKPGTTKVLGYGNAEDAKIVIKECIERWSEK
jgi:inorganic pyrophosphatase